jgi:glycine oxidase
MEAIGIVGGGISGLFLTYFLHHHYPSLTLYLIDQNPLSEWESEFPKLLAVHATTPKAGGMIAPFSEIEYHRPEMTQAWKTIDDLYEKIEQQLGVPIRYFHPTLEVTTETSEIGYLKRHYEFLKSQQEDRIQWIEGTEIQSRFPFLSSEVKAALYLPEEFHLHIPRLIHSMLSFFQNKPSIQLYYGHRLIGWKTKGKQVELILQSAEDSASYSLPVDHLILATGIYSALPQIQLIPIRGQMIALQPDPKVIQLDHMIRIRSRAYGRGYIVPKEETILLGSTSETKGFEEKATLGGILDIARRSYEVVPALYELTIQKVWAGLRPASKSFHPTFFHYQNTPVSGLNGLYRHGIMLAPLLAELFVQWMETKQLPQPFHTWIQTLTLKEQRQAVLV